MTPDWMKRAGCRGLPTELWFPEDGGTRPNEWALKVCAQCRVKDECLEYAIVHHEHGIWGGIIGEKARRNVRRRQRRASQGKAS